MPLLYECTELIFDEFCECALASKIPLGPAEETRTIHENWQITIPVLWSCNSDTKEVDIKWDSTRTRLVSAELYVRAYSQGGLLYLDYWVNEKEKLPLVWGAAEGGLWKEGRRDVLTWIRNGKNTFRAEYCKSIYSPSWPSCWVTATITLTYEGEPPDISPPEEPFDPMVILTYGGLALAGLGAAAALIYVLKG